MAIQTIDELQNLLAGAQVFHSRHVRVLLRWVISVRHESETHRDIILSRLRTNTGHQCVHSVLRHLQVLVHRPRGVHYEHHINDASSWLPQIRLISVSPARSLLESLGFLLHHLLLHITFRFQGSCCLLLHCWWRSHYLLNHLYRRRLHLHLTRNIFNPLLWRLFLGNWLRLCSTFTLSRLINLLWRWLHFRWFRDTSFHLGRFGFRRNYCRHNLLHYFGLF